VSAAPATAAGRRGLDALLAGPDRALLAFDFDGTLSPIVDDPGQARPHPGAVSALTALAPYVGDLAIVTGRPAGQAVELAGLDRAAGLERIVVLGHYGMERWYAGTGELSTLEHPPGLDRVRAELPGLLDSLQAGAAGIEDKGLSVAVHVRRLPEPTQTYERIVHPLTDLAQQHGLVAEPGRLVVELRPPGMDKGRALRSLVDELGSTVVVFTGDDLGDLAAFAEVARMRAEGLEGLLVCSGSSEQTALAEQADLVVDGPDGVVSWLTALADRLRPR